MLDFIVQYISKNFSDAIEFDKEIPTIDKAEKSCVTSIKRILHEIESGIDMVDIEVK